MLKKLLDNIKKKSLKERFLLVLGMFFFLMYFVIGLVIIFWKDMPIAMEFKYRVAFGILLIVYSFIRFVRFFNSNTD
ncbi:hypothetical protein [Flavobacterium hydatis]|uniref:Uncharacterized protein n=1 Tax=Flavobacterium hydatis TaxID=991 RepID=A0A086AU20_FLAHY|nr:hypothetical protein [Flavobacterium hydatis]KFF20184.1 hypothetical protein IW20_00040 [Flavobacterium hydatis]OXA98524.1 hypothetical protein B0A62_01605 [Flavobacterium hydatis]